MPKKAKKKTSSKAAKTSSKASAKKAFGGLEKIKFNKLGIFASSSF